MSWDPPPRITLTFSEHPVENSDYCDLSLEYSTSTSTTDPIKAGKQATILAERHLRNIRRAGRKRVPREHYDQATYEGRGILIKALAIRKVMLDVDTGTWSISVEGEKHYKMLSNSLRLPESSMQKINQDGEVIEIRIPKEHLEIEYAEWERTIGKPDPIFAVVTTSEEIYTEDKSWWKRILQKP